MIIASWILLAALTCLASSMSPPVPGAMAPSTNNGGHDESIDVPDKRILKYLLPSSQSWGGSSLTGQEGNKRGYNDRNFLRFGRSDVDKRGGNKNFLRFGRGDGEEYEDDVEPSLTADKRDRNFLRFGRDPGRNFIRFGRSGADDYGLERTPLEFAYGLKDEEPEKDKRYNGNNNFLRFGRMPNNNFLRFGRSVDRQTFCDDCEEEEEIKGKHLSLTSSSGLSASQDNANHMSSEQHSNSEDTESSTAARQPSIHRAKRSASTYYDYAAWARDFQPGEEEVDNSGLEELQDVNKRDYNRNFLRFGRDRNFLRFGKRDLSDLSPVSGSNMMMVTPVQYPRYVRASGRNFLRFG